MIGNINAYSDPEEFERVARLLNEPLWVVTSVFGTCITLSQCGNYRLPHLKTETWELRYCPVCINSGYHSHLHQIPWLAKCAFHAVALRKHSSACMGSPELRDKTTFRSLMNAACPMWPKALNEPFSIHEEGHLAALAQWVALASDAAVAMSQGEIWQTEVSDGHSDSLGQAFGLLRTLQPMPKELEPLFIDIGETWHIETVRFSKEMHRALVQWHSLLGVQALLDYYKVFTVRQGLPASFIDRAQLWRRKIVRLHGKCGCSWGQTRSGWYQNWLKVYPDERPQWSMICPYDSALQQMGFNSGKRDAKPPEDPRWSKPMAYAQACQYMHASGLVSWPDDISVPEKAMLFSPQNLRHLIWNGAPALNKLLGELAEREVDSAGIALIDWLDDIERGAHPAAPRKPVKSMRLLKVEDSLLLVIWTLPQALKECSAH